MRRQLRENQKEMIVHTSALGLGLIFCGTYDQGLTDELFNVIDVRRIEDNNNNAFLKYLVCLPINSLFTKTPLNCKNSCFIIYLSSCE